MIARRSAERARADRRAGGVGSGAARRRRASVTVRGEPLRRALRALGAVTSRWSPRTRPSSGRSAAAAVANLAEAVERRAAVFAQVASSRCWSRAGTSAADESVDVLCRRRRRVELRRRRVGWRRATCTAPAARCRPRSRAAWRRGADLVDGVPRGQAVRRERIAHPVRPGRGAPAAAVTAARNAGGGIDGMKVFVTGATGFVGSALVAALRARGDEVVVLIRDAARARAKRLGDVDARSTATSTAGPWTERAWPAPTRSSTWPASRSAAQRWNARVRSRSSATAASRRRARLVEAIGALPADRRPARAGQRVGHRLLPVRAPTRRLRRRRGRPRPTARASRSSAASVPRLGARGARRPSRSACAWCCMRTGHRARPGRAARSTKMATPFKLFVGGRIGSGRQWVSWIHLDDAVAAYLAAIDRRLRYTGRSTWSRRLGAQRASFAARARPGAAPPGWLPVAGVRGARGGGRVRRVPARTAAAIVPRRLAGSPASAFAHASP